MLRDKPKFGSRRHSSSEAGNLGVVASLLIPVLMVATAMGLNIFDMNQRKSDFQQSLDAAVLAASAMSTSSESERIAVAEKVLAANVDELCQSTTTSVVIDGNKVTGNFTCHYKAILAGIITPEWLTLKVTSVAEATQTGVPTCILALNKTIKRSFLASGGGKITGNDCRAHVNSSNVEAVTLSGGSSLTSAENCVVGGVKQGLSYMTPQPPASCDQIDDPFASITKPTVGSCDHYNFDVNTDMTIYPGVYCGGMRLANKTFHLEPGLYVVKDGTLESSGGATIIGDGVTFYLTGTTTATGAVLSGGGIYQLTAMKTGSLAGFVFYLDPGALKTSKSTVSGGGDTYFEGAFYFPGQTLLISGGGTVTTPSPFTAYVADLLEFTGGSDMTVGIDRSKSTVPIPSGFGTSGPPMLIQ